MLSEYVLLLLLSVAMLNIIIKPVRVLFQAAVPRMAIRMEKHLITGYQFCVDHPSGGDKGCGWKFD